MYYDSRPLSSDKEFALRHRRQFVFVLTLVTSFSLSCTYHVAAVDFRALERSGIFIAREPTLGSESRSYGEVEINERDFYFVPCDWVAADATERLLYAVRARGGTIAKNTKFRSRGRWSTNPKCRRNLNWAWLIIPIFLPVPQSVRIRAEAIYDPAFVAAE